MELPLPTVPDGTVVWHHTDAAGLIGILQAGRLWASAPQSMNDASEVLHGVDVLLRAVERRRPALPAAQRELLDRALDETMPSALCASSYLLSTTLAADSLDQWRNYSRREGYAIGLRTGPGLAVWPPPGAVEGAGGACEPGPRTVERWCRVLYEPEEQDSCVVRVLEHLLPGAARPEEVRQVLGGVAVLFKHSAFASEREARFVVTDRPGGEAERFRPGARGVVPYVEVAQSAARGGGPHHARLPVVAVRCGPLPEEERGVATGLVRRLLVHHGYTGVDVATSRVPYRF